MRGTVKFFDNAKGWGFITDENGKDHFVHYSSILIENGRKHLSEGDIVEFEVGNGATDREQAVNVQPILTRKMVEKTLEKENLKVKTMKDAFGVKKYVVTNAENVLQTDENGMTFEELVGYAGLHYPM